MKDNYTIALEVIADYYGIGENRKKALTALGYNYKDIQSIVNELVKDGITSDIAKQKLKAQNADTKFLVVDLDIKNYRGLQINIIV